MWTTSVATFIAVDRQIETTENQRAFIMHWKASDMLQQVRFVLLPQVHPRQEKSERSGGSELNLIGVKN